jgi:hypothetical protein
MKKSREFLFSGRLKNQRVPRSHTNFHRRHPPRRPVLIGRGNINSVSEKLARDFLNFFVAIAPRKRLYFRSV